MTPQQLRHIRGDRTREQFAAWLGDTSASTLNKWERNINPIPAWVQEKCLSNMDVTLPMRELLALCDLAKERNLSPEAMLSQALRDYLRAQTAPPTPQIDLATRLQREAEASAHLHRLNEDSPALPDAEAPPNAFEAGLLRQAAALPQPPSPSPEPTGTAARTDRSKPKAAKPGKQP